MREELIEKIMNMLISHNIMSDSIKNELEIILSNYEIETRETAVAVRDEDKNRYYLRKFLIAKTVAGRTKNTLAHYEKILTKILSEINKQADEITADDIRLYLALRDRRDHVSKVTQNNELLIMRSFFAYLMSEELINRNPTMRLERIKEKKIKKKAFTDMEVEELRAGCNNAKETMIVEILLSTGCRVSELAGIKLNEISDNSILIHGKGEKDRIVYLNAKAILAIQKYISERNDINPYLLPKMKRMNETAGYRKNAYRYAEYILPDGHSPKDTIEDFCRRLGKRCGIQDVHPHRFRRTCATFALRRGMPIEQVSKMLGHEQIGTTQIYLDLDENDLELAHRKYVT